MKRIRVGTLLLPYWKLILLSTLISLLAVGAQLLNPLIMKQMIDVALPRKEQFLIMLSVGGLVILPIVSTCLDALSKTIHNKIGGEITDKLTHQMYEHLMRLSTRTLNEYHSGNIAIRMEHVGEVGDYFVKWNLLPMPTDVFTLVGIVIIMLQMDWVLSLVTFLMIPIVVGSSSYMGQKIERNFDIIVDLIQKNQAYIVQLVGGMKTVQMMTREQEERSEQRERVEKYRRIRNKTFLIQKWRYELLSSLEKALGLAILFSVSIWFILKGQMTIGTLLAFTIYFPRFLDTAKSLRSDYMQFRELKPKLKEIEEVLNLPVEIETSAQAVPLKQAKGEIEFRNVSFSYGPKSGNIRHVSFHIRPGEFVGIVGPTGAGKSTLLDLLLRFYDPNEGQILLDGKDLREYDLHDLRNRIGLVTQDVFLWDKTIKENLLYAKPDATIDELVWACHIAQVTPFLERLPEGWDTVIGERGVKLSGGEKQRLGIARILLRQPEILLMDEPTSALDAKTEAQLQSELEPIFKDRTVIVVAHRLATIRNADRIIVIKDGTIAEMGTHEELMENRLVYHQLHTEQFQGALSANG